MTYLEALPLNDIDISPQRLNIEAKERSNPLPWNGQFSPQFVEELLRRYAAPRSRILDPFCGSGTVLHEAALMGLSATGIELNPAACALARLYELSNKSASQRQDAIKAVDTAVERALAAARKSRVKPDNYPCVVLEKARGDAEPLEKILLDALLVLSDFFKESNEKKLQKSWKRIRGLVTSLPVTREKISLIHGDGRYPAGRAKYDLVVTSPPYINVYNYHQQYRSTTEAMGWNLLDIARTEIGSNRKNRGNRFLTVIQYCLDLAECLASLSKVVSTDGRMIFVLGRESKVRGVSFLNGEIAAQLAVNAVGYRFINRQERVFTNRFGQRIFEDILHFEQQDVLNEDYALRARDVAKSHLLKALSAVSESTIKDDISSAIARVEQTAMSPRFRV